MRFNIRNKFLVPMIILVMVGMGGVSIISYTLSKHALQEALTGQIKQTADTTVANMQAWVRDRTLDVTNWSMQNIFQTAMKDSFVGKSARKSSSTELGRIISEYRYYEDINIANTDGEIVAGSDKEIIGKINVAERSYFKASMQGRTHVSQVI